jgi:hypothetical protein
MVPIEATVMPFPTELTTPPVTKIYFGIHETQTLTNLENPQPLSSGVYLESILGFCYKVPLVFGKAPGTIYNGKSLKYQILWGFFLIIKRQGFFVKFFILIPVLPKFWKKSGITTTAGRIDTVTVPL